MKRDWAGLTDIEVVSGTAEDGPGKYRGFVTVRATAADGSHMAGQLDPGTLRAMALNFLAVAEAADHDAIVMTLLTRDFELDPKAAASFVLRMRDERPPEPHKGRDG